MSLESVRPRLKPIRVHIRVTAFEIDQLTHDQQVVVRPGTVIGGSVEMAGEDAGARVGSDAGAIETQPTTKPAATHKIPNVRNTTNPHSVPTEGRDRRASACGAKSSV